MNLEPPEKKNKTDDHVTKKASAFHKVQTNKLYVYWLWTESTNCIVCTAIDEIIKYQRLDEKWKEH